jgi:hypothetical protein
MDDPSELVNIGGDDIHKHTSKRYILVHNQLQIMLSGFLRLEDVGASLLTIAN